MAENGADTAELGSLVEAVRRLHDSIRDDVVAACEQAARDDAFAAVERDGPGDTQYAIDGIAETALASRVDELVASRWPVELIAEGLEAEGSRILPEGTDPAAVRWKLLADPIDGTRGLMYQKRSAWILTAIAPADGTRLRDCVAAVMTEIPLVKQHLCDQLSAIRGDGVEATRRDRLSNRVEPLVVRPSSATTLTHGFAQVSRFFPGGRDELAAIDDEVMSAVCGAPAPGKALCFEDQYLSTAGQFYELLVGHDRFGADLRPGLAPGGLCCHPYDCGALLIAEEAGVILTGIDGSPLDAPLDLESDVAWAGYANASLRALVEPALQSALRRRGWLEP